jgi:hypothetical protein
MAAVVAAANLSSQIASIQTKKQNTAHLVVQVLRQQRGCCGGCSDQAGLLAAATSQGTLRQLRQVLKVDALLTGPAGNSSST